MKGFGELIVLLAAILAPWYLMAERIDKDEVQKSMASTAMAGIVGAHVAWKKKGEK